MLLNEKGCVRGSENTRRSYSERANEMVFVSHTCYENGLIISLQRWRDREGILEGNWA